MTTLAIDLVSDVVCPWCYLGKRRLEQALTARPDIVPELRFLPFYLDPSVPPEGMPRMDYITRKFGIEEKLTAGHKRLVGLGAEVGIDFQFERIDRQPNTRDAHRVIGWAQEAGRARPVVERLFELFFTEGADLSNRDVIAEAARAGGLDAAAVRRDLEGDRDAVLVDRQAAAATAAGIGGVPFFVFGKKVAVAGAHEPNVLLAAMEQALAASGDEPPAAA